MLKKYINAKLQIVRTNNDIVTASATISKGDPISNGSADAPGRRHSIWD